MQVCQSTNVYNPLSEKTPFVVHFNTDNSKEQEDRANAVVHHLSALSRDQLIKESHAFFKWTVMYHVGPSNLRYAEMLLRYFHSHDLLRCKQVVNPPMKQCKRRYLVIFTVGGHVFSQTYNSIRELKADTGKKPSQIKPELTKDKLTLHILD